MQTIKENKKHITTYLRWKLKQKIIIQLHEIWKSDIVPRN